MKPDLLLFKKHIQKTDFQIGVDDGLWGLASDDPDSSWPHIIIWVQAASKVNAPDRYFFKFDLSGYSESAPTACPWDADKS